MKELSEREVDLPEALIGELLKISSESKDIISLGPGEPDFVTPKPILKHGAKVIGKSTHYTSPQGITPLREAICKKLKKDNKINFKPSNIIVTPGSQSALFAGLLSVLDPKDQVVIPNPSYMDYIPAVELVSAVPKFVRLKESNNFEIDSDEIKKVIDKKKTRVIILNSPSNPTGTVIRKKVLEEVADIAVENDVYVFSDEAYEKVIYDAKHVSIGSLNGMKEYVVTFQTFSKAHAMCGFRVGYASGPQEVIEAMTKVSQYLNICAPNVSQLMGLKALSVGDKYIGKMLKEYRRRRNYIVPKLNELGLSTSVPDGAFYAFSNIKDYSKNSLKFVKDMIKKAKVAAVPGTEFGKFGEGYVRFSYATDLNKIKEAINRLEKFLK